MSHKRLLTDRTDLCKKRIFLDLDSPALIVTDVPVQSVKFMDFHYIEHILDGLHSEEVTSLIDEKSAISETRSIRYCAARHRPIDTLSSCITIDLHRHKLFESLHSPVESAQA